VLTLLARPREVYNRRTREYERAPETLGRVAKAIGVSIRTARRWKNEGVQPGAVSVRAAKRLARLAPKVSSAVAQALARDKEKHPMAIKLTRKTLPVLPVGHRRRLKIYGRDEHGNIVATGRTRASDWINYSVRRFGEVLELAWQAVRAKKIFQFIYEAPAGGSLPKSGDRPERRTRKKVRAATAPIDPYMFSMQADLAAYLGNYLELEEGRLSRRMLYVAVSDVRAFTDPRKQRGEEV
jgi:hypothetical protein